LRPKASFAQAAVLRYEASHQAMGTVFTVAAYGDEHDRLAEVIQLAFEEIDRLDAQMSNYKPTSEISHINRQAASNRVLVEPELFRLIEESLRHSAETEGAFDITVGSLVKAWGFFGGKGRVPPRAEIARALWQTGYRHVELDTGQRTIHFARSGMELDLGGIAKGFAVDKVVKILRAHGITTALISAGRSTIYALRAPPGELGWPVTVRDPYVSGKGSDVFYLRNCALSTSGSYQKSFTFDGGTYAHILDPRTGFPATGVLSASVVALSASVSDALATAFVVLGVKGSRKYVESHASLTALLYLPAGRPPQFKRVVLRSPKSDLPVGTLVCIEKGEDAQPFAGSRTR